MKEFQLDMFGLDTGYINRRIGRNCQIQKNFMVQLDPELAEFTIMVTINGGLYSFTDKYFVGNRLSTRGCEDRIIKEVNKVKLETHGRKNPKQSDPWDKFKGRFVLSGHNS